MKNIAIVGSKPDTWEACKNLDRRSWQIWRFSRKNYDHPPIPDVWFELHHPDNYARYEQQKPGYTDFIKNVKADLPEDYTERLDADAKSKGRDWKQKEVVLYNDFPWEDILAEFGPWFLHYGQAPWLIAYAIMMQPKEILLFGMEPGTDYGAQKREIQHWMTIAKERGIKIDAPEDKALQTYLPLYCLQQDWVGQSETLALLRARGVTEQRLQEIQKSFRSDSDPETWVQRMHKARLEKYGKDSGTATKKVA